MKEILAAICVLVLMGCSTTKPPESLVVKEVPIVFVTPTSMLTCDDYINYPNPDTMTEEEAVNLIATLDMKLKVCGVKSDSAILYQDKLIAEARKRFGEDVTVVR